MSFSGKNVTSGKMKNRNVQDIIILLPFLTTYFCITAAFCDSNQCFQFKFKFKHVFRHVINGINLTNMLDFVLFCFVNSRVLEVQFCNIDCSCSSICWHMFWVGHSCSSRRKNTYSKIGTSIRPPNLLL